jgi:hypothetical protein
MCSQRPDLISSVAVIMSFDLFIMHQLAKRLDALVLEGDRPALLLLTVNEEDSKLEENADCSFLSVTSPLPDIRSWLVKEDSKLDGVYIQYEPSMVAADNDVARKTLQALASDWTLGVWGTKFQPDNLATSSHLLGAGVEWVNTDLPRTFLEGELGVAALRRGAGREDDDDDFL